MKVQMIVLVVFAVAMMAMVLWAQSSLSISPAGTLATCPAPSSKALIFCNVAGDTVNPDGAYVSANGAAYFRVGATTAGGVTTFNGRSGNVLPASGDYKFSDLSAPPTTMVCTTASIATGGNLTASGCTLK